MSKRYNIKWTTADEKALTVAVRNFNSKITRTEKKISPNEKNALPERVSVKAIKELITTRQDLNRELNSLRRFMEKGAEELITISDSSIDDSNYNLKTTKYQKQEISIRLGVINRRRKKRLEEMQNIYVEDARTGESLGYTRGEFGMGKAELNSLKPLKNPLDNIDDSAGGQRKSYKDVRKFYKHIQKESANNWYDKKDATLKENYIRELEKNFHSDDISEVVDAVRNMDFKDFYKGLQKEGGVKPAFEWVYPEERGTENYRGVVSKLKSQWTKK